MSDLPRAAECAVPLCQEQAFGKKIGRGFQRSFLAGVA